MIITSPHSVKGCLLQERAGENYLDLETRRVVVVTTRDVVGGRMTCRTVMTIVMPGRL